MKKKSSKKTVLKKPVKPLKKKLVKKKPLKKAVKKVAKKVTPKKELTLADIKKIIQAKIADAKKKKLKEVEVFEFTRKHFNKGLRNPNGVSHQDLNPKSKEIYEWLIDKELGKLMVDYRGNSLDTIEIKVSIKL